MELKDLRAKKPEILKRDLLEIEDVLRGLRFQLSSNQLSNVRKVRKIRQEIAQIKTVIREKTIES